MKSGTHIITNAILDDLAFENPIQQLSLKINATILYNA